MDDSSTTLSVTNSHTEGTMSMEVDFKKPDQPGRTDSGFSGTIQLLMPSSLCVGSLYELRLI